MTIGVGTGGGGTVGPWPTHFFCQLFLKIFVFVSNAKLKVSNDLARREEHKTVLISFLGMLGFPQSHVKVYLAPSLFEAFLHPCR